MDFYGGKSGHKPTVLKKKILPAKDLHVALYLASLAQLSRTPSPVIQAFYSIRWAHYVISVNSHTESFLVKNILEGAKRRLCVPTVKKEPVTPELLQKMYDSLISAKNVINVPFVRVY